jgi:hypothetical protein
LFFQQVIRLARAGVGDTKRFKQVSIRAPIEIHNAQLLGPEIPGGPRPCPSGCADMAANRALPLARPPQVGRVSACPCGQDRRPRFGCLSVLVSGLSLVQRYCPLMPAARFPAWLTPGIPRDCAGRAPYRQQWRFFGVGRLRPRAGGFQISFSISRVSEGQSQVARGQKASATETPIPPAAVESMAYAFRTTCL